MYDFWSIRLCEIILIMMRLRLEWIYHNTKQKFSRGLAALRNTSKAQLFRKHIYVQRNAGTVHGAFLCLFEMWKCSN